jgi:hypothetical protein
VKVKYFWRVIQDGKPHIIIKAGYVIAFLWDSFNDTGSSPDYVTSKGR